MAMGVHVVLRVVTIVMDASDMLLKNCSSTHDQGLAGMCTLVRTETRTPALWQQWLLSTLFHFPLSLWDQKEDCVESAATVTKRH